MPETSTFSLDNRERDDAFANQGKPWRAVTDTVMGGISQAALHATMVDGKPCLRLSGEVRLENNGGFVQASLDLGTDGLLDASGFDGIEIEVCGNNDRYNLHLRTADTQRVWQSYRHSFTAGAHWQTLRIPFTAFVPHRIQLALNTRQLRRIGIVAIGRKMQADICFRGLALYRTNLVAQKTLPR
ncbi:CIA30 family protein [Ferrigenium sp. UT5]|uniref:CIA30 family protein n=1 Tax=Ferrigenium sp. UT5 TaxID=3242105 RepID=UPI0035516D65